MSLFSDMLQFVILFYCNKTDLRRRLDPPILRLELEVGRRLFIRLQWAPWRGGRWCICFPCSSYPWSSTYQNSLSSGPCPSKSSLTLIKPWQTSIKHSLFSENLTYIEPTELRMDKDYQIYYINWIRAILSAFIPFLLLAILNGKIIWQMKKAEEIVSTRVRTIDTSLVIEVTYLQFSMVGYGGNWQ